MNASLAPRISLITLGVADLAASTAFYESLGWKQVAAEEGISAFDLLGQTLGLYPKEKLAEDLGIPVSEMGGFSGITFGHNVSERADVDRHMTLAEQAGARIVRPAAEIFWGGYIGYFADLDGHIWEIAHNPFSKLGPNGEFQWDGVE